MKNLIPSIAALITIGLMPMADAQTLPSSYSIIRGIYVSGTLNDLFFSDNSRVVIQPQFQFSPTLAQAELQAVATSPIAWPVNGMSVVVERATTPWPPFGSTVYQKVLLRNRVTGMLDIVWQSNVLWLSDFISTITLANPNDYIDPVSLAVEARVWWWSDEPWNGNSNYFTVFGATVDRVVFNIW